MILWRAADPAAAGSCAPSLTPNLTGMADVEPGSWYVGAANWAVSSRVINGFDEGGGRLSFRPGEPVTAEQVAKIFCNYANGGEAGDPSALAGRTDRADVSSWAEGAVAWARGSGLMSGYDNGDGTFTFRPGETTARERAATVIMKAYRIGVLS